MPDERDFVGLCRDERGLVQIGCEVWQGKRFVGRVHGLARRSGSAPLNAT